VALVGGSSAAPPTATLNGSACFRTAPAFDGATPPAEAVWAANASQQVVLLRGSFFNVSGSSSVIGGGGGGGVDGHGSSSPPYVLHVAAKPVPSRLWNHKSHGGNNASKLLGAFKVYVNGVPVAMGPGA
jgi:hypothetical protein